MHFTELIKLHPRRLIDKKKSLRLDRDHAIKADHLHGTVQGRFSGIVQIARKRLFEFPDNNERNLMIEQARFLRSHLQFSVKS